MARKQNTATGQTDKATRAVKTGAKLEAAEKQEQAGRVLAALRTLYPALSPHLAHSNPWELLVATLLSAQCTDARVNMVTPSLFARWPGPAELALADLAELEECIRSTGFYHNKAKNLISSAQKIMRAHGGEVPRSMEELTALDGVARKTAAVVLWGGFGLNQGLAVDTHVMRLAFRLGLTVNTEQNKIEKDLMAIFPQEEWGNVNHRMVSFGREICKARKPDCPNCPMLVFCPRCGV